MARSTHILGAAFFGILFLMQFNQVQPSSDGSFFELYAIAGAVLGGERRQAAPTPSGPGAVKMILIDPSTGVMFGGVSPGKDNYAIAW